MKIASIWSAIRLYWWQDLREILESMWLIERLHSSRPYLIRKKVFPLRPENGFDFGGWKGPSNMSFLPAVRKKKILYPFIPFVSSTLPLLLKTSLLSLTSLFSITPFPLSANHSFYPLIPFSCSFPFVFHQISDIPPPPINIITFP